MEGKNEGLVMEDESEIPVGQAPPHEDQIIADAPSSIRDKVVKITETLKCVLSEDEIRGLGIKSAQASAEIAQVEDELQAVKSQFKSKINKLTATRNDWVVSFNQKNKN
jgi:predicted  nucleic acid-binding Zn-ribbon protein